MRENTITKVFEFGMFSTNCYVSYCEETQEAVIIDPGFDNNVESKSVISFIEEQGLVLKHIINTHGHPDHTCGNEVIKQTFHIPISIHEEDAYMLGESGMTTAKFFGFNHTSSPADKLLHDGDCIEFGKAKLKVLHTPGHSAGSIMLVGENHVFSGDTLFAGSIGRTDFPGSSDSEKQCSLKKLLNLSDSCLVYPGHGPETTMGEEKRANPFLHGL